MSSLKNTNKINQNEQKQEKTTNQRNNQTKYTYINDARSWDWNTKNTCRTAAIEVGIYNDMRNG